ncbi:peptidoglycan DD-metalloendopeptidase family protein [Nocardioides sp.]|uniref:peptidoglycan DD-metalloendopeptidase family protein n=1 Tax=Nocardioides sp. TaxID=35761 RepID=UPI0035661ACA
MSTACAVLLGPLSTTVYADGGSSGNSTFSNGSSATSPTGGGHNQSSGTKGTKGKSKPKKKPKGKSKPAPTSDPGTYAGKLVLTDRDVSTKPTAAPVTPYEMPFPCGEVWTGTTRSSHSPSTRSVDFNRADDFGDPVLAAAGGVVTTAVTGKNRPSYGQFVVIEHGNDESTLYAHLDSLTVTVGETVTVGTQIGTLGNTGNSSGAHLHFEERKASSVVDSWFHAARYVFGTAQASQNCEVVAVPDIPLAGNIVGGKKAELVVYRRTGKPSFRIQRDGKRTKVIKFGSSSDQPLLGDWNGNGRVSPAVRNPTTKTFSLKNKRAVTKVKFGGRKDLAISGDWDGDGIWEVGVRRAGSGVFKLRAADGSVTKVRLGRASDIPVTGDWDGDGITDLGFYDGETATFTLRLVEGESAEAFQQVQLGEPGDLPVAADWDANGVTDLAVWDPNTATYKLRLAPSPTMAKAKVAKTRFGQGR